MALVDTGFLHLYPFDGIKVLVKPVSLFISPRGESVEDDDYKKPCGSFTCYRPLLWKYICFFSLQIWYVDSSCCETLLWSSNICSLYKPAYQDHLLLEYGPRIIMFLVLWMVARPYFSSANVEEISQSHNTKV